MVKLMMVNFILLSALFGKSGSALTKAACLILFSIWVGCYAALVSGSFWGFAVLVLVFSSGMMVMFLYLTTLANQDKNSISPNIGILIFSVSSVAFVMTWSSKTSTKLQYLLATNFSSLNSAVVSAICVYLIFSLLCVFKYSQSFKGSLMITKFF